MNEIALQDKRTVLVVSHNLDMINRLCNRAILLNRGSIISFGDAASVVECYLSKQNQPLPASWVRSESAPAPNRACLIAIDILDENESPKSTFFFGQGFRIKIRLRNQTGSPLTCFIGVEILTENGFSLFTTNSNDKRQMDMLPVGDSVIECNFNPNLLLPGKYSVRAGLVDGVLTVLDFIDPDLYIEISDVACRNYPISVRRPGRIVVPLDWSELRSAAVASS